MAIAVVQEWDAGSDRSTDNYDAIDERLRPAGVPDGLIAHCAGFSGDTFRIFDIWESDGAYNRFLSEQLQPAIEALVPADQPPPNITVYELHNVITR